MDVWQILVFSVVGGGLGAAAVAVCLLIRCSRLQTCLAEVRTRGEMCAEQSQERLAEIVTLRKTLDVCEQQRDDARTRITALTEQVSAREENLREQKRLLAEAEQRLSDSFAALGAKALRANNEQFLDLAKKSFETLMSDARGDVEKRQQAIEAIVRPIRELLEKHGEAVNEIERKREVAYRGLEEQIRQIATSHEKLNLETNRLVTALRRPEQRGRWGELQLRNAVEMAGMLEHCDFCEQPQTDDPGTRDRPDMVVHLPGGGRIVVDSKIACDAYLDALQPDTDRTMLLRRHSELVEKHWKNLASKRYWEQFDRSPGLVVMFMPLESALVAALEVKPTLHAEAMKNHVLIATPTLLVALLRAVAYGWQQEAIAANAREIASIGQELYDRVGKFVEHFEEVGNRLGMAVGSYNRAIGSLERRILPSTRKLRDLGATTRDELESPPRIDLDARVFADSTVD